MILDKCLINETYIICCLQDAASLMWFILSSLSVNFQHNVSAVVVVNVPKCAQHSWLEMACVINDSSIVHHFSDELLQLIHRVTIKGIVQ